MKPATFKRNAKSIITETLAARGWVKKNGLLWATWTNGTSIIWLCAFNDDTACEIRGSLARHNADQTISKEFPKSKDGLARIPTLLADLVANLA